ncbi:MAG TPA: DUF3052 family protein [Pyrinomonadaceae bacterium]|jgi:hypothetical protein|nr:DUF3052 family protein [Pyrinomonadaceae bacterium]
MTTGYSGTPLVQKLGIRSGHTVLTLNAPDDYRALLGDPYDIKIIADKPAGRPDVIHLFTNSRDELFAKLPDLRNVIKQDGSIWVSWYKQAAKLPTEITEDTVREAALPLGLVDVKVCAVDEKWSGLKLVIRRENRS